MKADLYLATSISFDKTITIEKYIEKYEHFLDDKNEDFKNNRHKVFKALLTRCYDLPNKVSLDVADLMRIAVHHRDLHVINEPSASNMSAKLTLLFPLIYDDAYRGPQITLMNFNHVFYTLLNEKNPKKGGDPIRIHGVGYDRLHHLLYESIRDGEVANMINRDRRVI